MQGETFGDVLHCEEQLRTTLFCDDEDNLRRKLAQLRHEYLKTAQKLQRAEQLEAVRKKVRTDVAPKRDRRRRRNQAGPDGTSKPTDGASPAESSCSGPVRTALASTPEANGGDPARVSRASPTLRLRSRRSRMRWERRSEEGGKSQGEARFADESQSSESTSPSLLLSHWNVPELQDEKKEADVPDDVNTTENCTGGHRALQEKSPENSLNQSSFSSLEMCAEGEGKSLPESCTLVEGLLFPAEYYVRTTRRMAVSRSQPDLRAVVHTQLSSGRPRRKKSSLVSSISVADTPAEAILRPRVPRPGRGRGRGNLQRASPSPGPALGEADSPNCRPTPEELEPPSDGPQATSADTQPSSGAQKVFPIFHTTLKSSSVVAGSESWGSLLLPFPKLTPTPPLPARTQLVGHVDLHQDFHLPDEQFASLKLGKLRQVAVESFACRRANTLGVPLGLTPTAGKSSSQSEDRDPRNTRLSGTSRSDPRNVCPSPADHEANKAIQNGHSADSQLRLSPPAARAPPQPTRSAHPSSPTLGLATSPTHAAAPSLSLAPPPILSPQHDTATPAPDAQTLPAGAEHASCTLQAPAGSGLVDACCLLDSDGRLCVAAAAKWALSLWSRPSSSLAWTRRHTWPFTEPLMNVFPVPDAAGLVCVTLGRLAIKEVRALSCGGGQPVLLLEGVVQAAVGVAQARVVTSSLSPIGCTLQVFTLSNDGSASRCLRLASPDVCVRALARVDVLPDALIGTDGKGRLFVWNLKSGHLLQKIELEDSLSHTSCLRGFSRRGVLFVLLQHLFLGCLPKEEKEPALFSLVAVNPLCGKSVLAAHLEPPASWSGRMCDADASDVAAVGVNPDGCACVWQLRRRCDGVTVTAAPDGKGWQLARWAEDGATLLTGHHNGDLTLHFDLANQDPFM